jgi:hypothetical protein
MESALPGILALRFFLPATSDFFVDFVFAAAAFFGFAFALGFGFGFAFLLRAEDFAFLVAMVFVLSLR